MGVTAVLQAVGGNEVRHLVPESIHHVHKPNAWLLGLDELHVRRFGHEGLLGCQPGFEVAYRDVLVSCGFQKVDMASKPAAE